MKAIILLLTIFTLTSCVTEKKARGWAYSHKDKLAEWCADCFPVKPVEIIKGDTITILDSVLRIDSVRMTVDCPDGTKVDCPPSKKIYITKRTHSTDTFKVRDTAYERVLEDKNRAIVVDNNDLKNKLQEMTESRDKWRKWFWIIFAIIGAGVIAKIYFR